MNKFYEVLSAFFLIIEYQKKYYTKLCLYNLVILGVPFISLCRIRFCNRNCNALRCIIIFIELAFVDFVLLVSSCHSQCYFCSLNMFVYAGYVSIGCYMILLGEAEALFGKPILHTSITTIYCRGILSYIFIRLIFIRNWCTNVWIKYWVGLTGLKVNQGDYTDIEFNQLYSDR